VDPTRRVVHDRISIVCPPSSSPPSIGEALKVIDQHLPRTGRPYVLGIFGARFDRSLLDWNAPASAMLEISGPSLIDPVVQEVVAKLKEKGVKMVLRGRSHGHLPREFFGNFEFSIIQDSDDSRKNRPKQEPAPGGVAVRRLPFMIAGLSNTEDETNAFMRDAIGSVGWVDRPVLASDFNDLEPSRVIVESALKLAEEHGDIEEIMALIRLDPVLLLRFLKFIQPLLDAGEPVKFLSQTIATAGYRRLSRWLGVVKEDSVTRTHDLPLYYQAIRRGYLMEQLCPTNIETREKAYLIGLMSVVNKIGDITQDRLESLLTPLGPAGQNVLSDLGKFMVPLDITTMIETNDLMGVPRSAKGLGMSMSELNAAVFRALKLANAVTENLGVA
jgi:hypothetical protein